MRHLTLLFLVPALVGLQACQKADTSSAGAVEVSVQAAHPFRGSIAEHVFADAILSPLAQAAIAPRISAPVVRFYVQRGSQVKQGELLATLEHRDLQAAELDARGGYMTAHAALATTKGAQVPEETQRSQLDVAQAEATLKLDRSIVDARAKLVEEGAIPGRDLDTARATLVQAQAAYDVAVEHLKALEAVSRKATLEQSQGAEQSAQGKLQGAEAQVGYSEIRSPISGLVTDRPLFPGETASVGVPLLTIMDTSALLAKLHLAQSSAQLLRVGDTASVSIPGMDQPVQGTVSLLSPALDPGSTTLEVWVRLENRDGRFKAGTPVHTRLTARSIPNALLVPTAALLPSSDGGKYVMLLGADGKAHRQAVSAGITDGENTQVLSGLSARDNVIVEGAYGLDDGTKVKAAAAGNGKPGSTDTGGGQ